MRSICHVIAVASGLWIACCSDVSAQILRERHGAMYGSPYQQRLSPYLDLMRDDRSVLPPYHSFVRPRQEFRQRLNRQAAQIGRLGQAIGRPTSASTYSSSVRIPTGRGGTFYNYLHYFPINQGGQR